MLASDLKIIVSGGEAGLLLLGASAEQAIVASMFARVAPFAPAANQPAKPSASGSRPSPSRYSAVT
jgi:hypothetical protein